MKSQFRYRLELPSSESLTGNERVASKTIKCIADNFVLVVDRKPQFLTMWTSLYTCWESSWPEAGWLFYLKQLKNRTQYMKQTFSDIEHQTVQDRDPWKRESKWREPYNQPSLLPEEFPGCDTGEKNPREPGGHLEVNRQSWESREAKAVRVSRAEDHRRESHLEQDLQGSAEGTPRSSAESCSAHLYKEVREKKQPEKHQRENPQSLHRAVHVPTQ